MNRGSFVAATVALAADGVPGHVLADALVGRSLTQRELFSALPAPHAGDWTRVTMGSGVQYDKQMGFGLEKATDGDMLFVETQIGEAGGIACNPNTLKKTYLREAHFGSFVTAPAVLAIVARSGSMLTRWADIRGGQTQEPHDAHMRLLDEQYLYDERPMTIRSVATRPLHFAGKTRATTHVVADFPRGGRLEQLDIWHAASVPFGVARYRATLRELDPFGLALETFGGSFKTAIATPLALLRPMTQSGIMVLDETH